MIKRILLNALKLGLLVVIGVLLYRSFVRVAPPPAPGMGDNDADDKKYVPVVPVSVGTITRATLRDLVDAYGTVEPEPGSAERPPAVARVGPPMFAVVKSVSCIEGQHVEKGQVLLSFEGRSNQGAFDLASPLSGTVTEVNVGPGDVADPRRPAVTVIDLGRLVVAISLPAQRINELAIGQPAEIVRGANGAATQEADEAPTTRPVDLSGRIVRVDRQIDPKTGMGSADVSLPPDSGMRPGEFVHVRVVIAEHRDCLTVPAVSIVKDADGKDGVSLIEHDFHWAYRHPVRLGLSDGDRVEIEAPELKAGQPVVTTGAYALTDQCRIDVVR